MLAKRSGPVYNRRMRLLPIFQRLAVGMLCALGGGARADDVNVAVAANFSGAIKPLAAAFERATSHRLVISLGASGVLYAQIHHGAPFDVLLSADTKFPKKLEAEGRAVRNSRFTYAIGRLVLWSPQPGYIDARAEILRRGDFARIAIANPNTAPYGAAAEQTLRKLELWEQLQARVIRGDNVAQALQFIHSGNAPLGFIALAQLQALPNAAKGSHWLVPVEMHAPLRQEAVLLKRAADKATARAFLEFLRSARARSIIESLGYATAP